ncbi:MAG: hypothetical protein RJA77_353 [Pseudomonadota bacterium]|jgi:hypothetical protein
MPTHPLLSSPSEWLKLQGQAKASRGALVPLVLVTLEHCPYCKLLIREQLIPRMKEGHPQLRVLEFDLSDTTPIETRGPLSKVNAKLWAREHRFRLAPTLVAVNPDLKPIGDPLLGYSSPDFYSAYLEDLILAAQAAWRQNL